MAPPSQVGRQPIIPGRVRRIDSQGFAFLPNRFLQGGFFVSLSRDELALYLLLVLAGDRNGVSFYHFDSLCSTLGLPLEHYLQIRNALIDLDLIAFDGTRYQVLSLPDRPVHRPAPPLRSPQDLEDHDHDPATIRALLRSTLSSDPDDQS
jgi:hypothetical protein